MFFKKMSDFCKNVDCPSSEELLSYNKNGIIFDYEQIHEHIMNCDFCSAEIDFYSNHQLIEESITVSEIPSPLYELAESLLNKSKGSYLLNKLLIENEGLKLNKV